MKQPAQEYQKYADLLTTVFPLPDEDGITWPVETAPTAKVKAIRIRKADGTYNLRLHVENNGQLEPPLEFPVDELRTKILKIKNYSVAFNSIEISNIINGINNEFMKLSPIPTLDALDKIGWQYDTFDNITGWKSATGFDLQGSPQTKDIFASYPTYNGNLDDNISFVKEYISKHGAVAQSILLYGFSAVLIGHLFKQAESTESDENRDSAKKTIRNLLLNLSGKSSRGKTTIAKLVISFYTDPEDNYFSKTFNVTLNKMAEDLDKINGVTVLIDDLSLAPQPVKKALRNMVYTLSDGKEKERMSTKYFDRDPAQWSTTIILSSEVSILHQCDQEHEGAVGRLMELDISPDDLFIDAAEANQIADLSHKHYGLLAEEFIKRLIASKKINDLRNSYQQEVNRIQKGYSDVMARVAESIAIITLCGELLNQLFAFQFDTTAVENYLIATTNDNLENFRISQKGNVIMQTIYPQLIEYAKEACPDENKNPTDHVVISSKATKAILAKIQEKFGYKPIEVKRALKEGGVLYANDGPYSYNGTINGKSFRGLYLYIKDTEEQKDNE